MTNKLRTDYDFLNRQHYEYAKGGLLFKNLINISVHHPWLSVIFIFTFGLLANMIARLANMLVSDQEQGYSLIGVSLLLVVYLLIMMGIILCLRHKYIDFFKKLPLSRRKALITLVSPREVGDYKQTPTFKVVNALLYSDDSRVSLNALERIALIATESAHAKATAEDLQQHIQSEQRRVEIYIINVAGYSLIEIQKQLENLIIKLKTQFQPYEIIADYTGGTKPMSIALVKACEENLILPIYLNDASNDAKGHQL